MMFWYLKVFWCKDRKKPMFIRFEEAQEQGISQACCRKQQDNHPILT